MNYSLDTVEERDGWLYIRSMDTNYSEPTLLVHWYPIGLSVREYRRLWSDKPLGQQVRYLGDGLYRDEGGQRYRLTEGGQTRSTHLDTVPIPPPKQRGKPCPVKWEYGCWKKYTRQGWVEGPLNVQELYRSYCTTLEQGKEQELPSSSS